MPEALVVAVGGGGTPRAVIREMIRLGRERSEVAESGQLDVVVLPYASSREERGVASAAMWIEEGASTAVVSPSDGERAAVLFAQAEILWMGGGDQGRLLDDLERMGLVDDILRAHARGAIVGGTSAGAAVLGSVCIAGDPDPDAYVRGGMTGRPGLGLVPGAIIDQHFRERRREGRLLTAVLDAGGICGYGVSESTALLLSGARGRVMGEGVVIVFDATDAKLAKDGTDAATPWSAARVNTSIWAPAEKP
jgi:cyanophycinase